MNDYLFESPVDGHRHFAPESRNECSVCELQDERDGLRVVLNDKDAALADIAVERDRLRRVMAPMLQTYQALEQYSIMVSDGAASGGAMTVIRAAVNSMSRAVEAGASTFDPSTPEYQSAVNQVMDACEEIDRLRKALDGLTDTVTRDLHTLHRISAAVGQREDLAAAVHAVVTERDRLRSGLDTILDGLVDLDSDDAYMAITREHLNVVRAMFRKAGT